MGVDCQNKGMAQDSRYRQWRDIHRPGRQRLPAGLWRRDQGAALDAVVPILDGQRHVLLGGRIMGWLFDAYWRDFTCCHSRHWAKRAGKRYSKLCLADKLAFVLTPAWLYLPMARMSGELQEYMRVASGRQLCGSITDFEQSLLNSRNSRVWLEGLKIYTRRWIEQHRNGTLDHWTVLRSQAPQEQAFETRT